MLKTVKFTTHELDLYRWITNSVLMANETQRDTSVVRIDNRTKTKLDEIKEDEGYRTYDSAINGVIKERELLQDERDMLRTVLGNVDGIKPDTNTE